MRPALHYKCASACSELGQAGHEVFGSRALDQGLQDIYSVIRGCWAQCNWFQHGWFFQDDAQAPQQVDSECLGFTQTSASHLYSVP